VLGCVVVARNAGGRTAAPTGPGTFVRIAGQTAGRDLT
jgi:hypothetical protein